MKSIDRNDVSISKLFNWGKKLDIKDSVGKDIKDLSYYIRVVGDSELNRARVFSLRKSAELRKKLRTKNTDEHIAYIPDFTNLDSETILETIIAYSVKDISSIASRNLNLNLPTEPDTEASLEEHERYQQKIDDWPEERHKLILKEIDKEVEKERKRLSKVSKKNLEKMYEKYIINNLCETEMYSKFTEMCTFFGSYVDSKYKKRAFKNVEEFNNLPSHIKEQFINMYMSLDILSNDLKKLPGATQ